MKITKIEQKEWIYEITLEPNWLERLFNVKSKVVKYKQGNSWFPFTGLNQYIDENGNCTGANSSIGAAIDKFKRQ